MVDRATGASPPMSSTQEMASSPINFDDLIQKSTSDGLNNSPTRINDRKKNLEVADVMSEMVNNKNMLLVASPSTSTSTSTSTNGSTSTSTNGTPITSLSSMAPVPLMSIRLNKGYGINSTSNLSSMVRYVDKKSNNNRRWSIHPPGRYNFKYHKQRAKNTRRYQLDHHRQCYCGQCFSTPQTATLGNIF